MYFSEEQVSISFKRLASRKRTEGKKSKTHLERTSVLMCFLAFDARCKAVNLSRLDMNPDKPDGRANREAVALEFTKLVLLDPTPRKIIQVLELGKVSGEVKNPATRLSSNFFTVPLKKATEHTGFFIYPKRPSAAPMLQLGEAATGIKWGVEYHKEWPNSFPKFLFEVKDSTPFTDLAIFVMRDTHVNGNDYVEALANAIKVKYSDQVGNFWIDKIKKEKLLVRHILKNPFSSAHQAFCRFNQISSADLFDGVTQRELLDHISHLEGILSANQVEFESLRNKINL